MPIQLVELLDVLEETLDYPVTSTEVVRRIGPRVIEAPDQGDSKSVAAVLEPVGEETFGSAEAVFEALLANLDDAYIGRKFYDDRGSNVLETGVSGPRDEGDESF